MRSPGKCRDARRKPGGPGDEEEPMEEAGRSSQGGGQGWHRDLGA